MNRVRMFACAGAGLALAALGWCLPDTTGLSAAMVSRSAGLALLGIAMVAAGLVFRSAMMAGKKTASAPKAGSRSSEFRRGFDKNGKVRGKQSLMHQPTQSDVVVALRRAVAEQAQMPQAIPSGVTLPAEEVERLQSMLHQRAAELRTRNADQAQRRFLRSGVDVHGLART
jgi:hypothetical protein